MASFSIKESLQFGFKTTKKKFLFLLGIIGMYAVFYVADHVLDNLINDNDILLTIIQGIISFVVQSWIGLGITQVFLLLASGKKTKFADIFNVTDKLWQYILASLLITGLYILIIIIGVIIGGISVFISTQYNSILGWGIVVLEAIAFLIGMIYLNIRLSFLPFVILENKINGYQAIKKSFAITKNHMSHLFLFSLATIGVALLGVLALGIGLFIALPTICLANAHVYRKLVGKK